MVFFYITYFLELRRFLDIILQEYQFDIKYDRKRQMGQDALKKRMKQLDTCFFKYPDLMKMLENKKQINFKDVKGQCVEIGEGYSGVIYLYRELDIVLKIMKGNPKVENIIKEIVIMDKVNSIWPQLFKYLVLDGDKLVGFSMKFFNGKKIWEAYRQEDNIYYRSAQSRVRLVKKVKECVKKLQLLKICHGDMHIDNIMIKQLDKNKQDCQILIIDYGLAFIIDEYSPQKPSLTGWSFMLPHQSKTQLYYNTAGLNAYMFGRVALQILLLQNYDQYSHSREQSPKRQLDKLGESGFDPSIRDEIELYLHEDINQRTKALIQQQSRMKQHVNYKQQQIKLNSCEYQTPKFSLTKIFLGQTSRPSLTKALLGHSYKQQYFVSHPQKLGYQ